MTSPFLPVSHKMPTPWRRAAALFTVCAGCRPHVREPGSTQNVLLPLVQTQAHLNKHHPVLQTQLYHAL